MDIITDSEPKSHKFLVTATYTEHKFNYVVEANDPDEAAQKAILKAAVQLTMMGIHPFAKDTPSSWTTHTEPFMDERYPEGIEPN